LNGIFHNVAQEVYKYGNHKPNKRLMGPQRVCKATLGNQLRCFEKICMKISQLVKIVNPKKTLVLCVDGPAPLSKQNQQRQRRFRAAIDRDEKDQSFDSTCISPGTQFMDYLSKYIDWFIRREMSNGEWKHLEVIFSNEKVPGEGEHLCVSYVRKHGNKDDTFCIQGADADLIMLSLATHFPNFYILRDDMRNPFEFYVIDMCKVRQGLIKDLNHDQGKDDTGEDEDNKGVDNKEVDNKGVDNDKSIIDDFILMCFFVGNDFLPHIPGIEIIHEGIDIMFQVYHEVSSKYGYLTERTNRGVRFRKKSFAYFIELLGNLEEQLFQEKMKTKEQFFPDPMLEAHSSREDDNEYKIDLTSFKKEYYLTNLPNGKIRQMCHDYLEGVQWVLSYYTEGVSNWKWRFEYHYAPFCSTLAKTVKSFKWPIYSPTKPTLPFIQLLSILPPKSRNLLPEPLNNLLIDSKSPLKEYCPDVFDIDLSGKKQEWEGTVLLPMIDYDVVEKIYLDNLRYINQRDIKRNVRGKSYIYTKANVEYPFNSYYGNFTCKVTSKPIDI